MRFGFVLPGGTATEQLEQAVLAERAGWDGVFVWEAAYGVDAWTLLSAMAQRTSHLRLGTMLTPLPWRRPWKVASQAATLDQLSGGRAILSVGLGAIVTGLWDGRMRFAGRRYDVDLEERSDLAKVVAPVQRPRIPVWVVAAWPRPKSMRRALRCDGLLPVLMNGGEHRGIAPDDIRAMLRWLQDNGVRPGFDVVMEGETPADDPAAARAVVAPWEEAGCTWWLDARWEMPHESPERMRQVRERLQAGPPRPT